MFYLLYLLQGTGTSYRSIKSFMNPKLLSSVLVLLLFCGIYFGFPQVARAALLVNKPLRPSYVEQLEAYKGEVASYKAGQERVKQENAQRIAVIQHLVKPGETLSSIARAYNTDMAALVNLNGLQNPHLIRQGQILQVYPAGGNIPEQGNKAVSAVLASRREDQRQDQKQGNLKFPPSFQWPLAGEITSYYGWRKDAYHYGLDIAAPTGELINAAAPGYVEQTGSRRGYGLTLTIDHGRGWSSLYAHNSTILVREGEFVISGQPIARIGATGNATGPHLHLEIILNGDKLDPLLFLPKRK